jgi:hypothetical protein
MSSLLSAAASLLLAGGAGADGAEGRSLPIREGRELTLDVPCTAGALIRGSVEPDHQAVVVRLRDPAGELLAEVRNPVLLDEPLPIAGLPARSGICLLTLSLETGPPGSVLLRMEPLRPATEHDRTRIEGERLHQRALLLWSEGSEVSQRQALELEARAAALAGEAGDLRGKPKHTRSPVACSGSWESSRRLRRS